MSEAGSALTSTARLPTYDGNRSMLAFGAHDFNLELLGTCRHSE